MIMRMDFVGVVNARRKKNVANFILIRAIHLCDDNDNNGRICFDARA